MGFGLLLLLVGGCIVAVESRKIRSGQEPREHRFQKVFWGRFLLLGVLGMIVGVLVIVAGPTSKPSPVPTLLFVNGCADLVEIRVVGSESVWKVGPRESVRLETSSTALLEIAGEDGAFRQLEGDSVAGLVQLSGFACPDTPR